MGKLKRKKYHKRSKRHLIINATLILILFMTIGFATINANLGILGNINLKKFSVFAKNLSYDNTNTGIDCSDAQCMLDYLGAADPVDFSTDSWATIIKAVKSGDTSSYSVGDTKTVEMGDLGTHTLRIANTTTPSECSTTGFSQTACGFVLEFVDIITTHNMNSTSTNVGGWPASSMREYVNSDIYNALPSGLKNAVIDTIVVSGHGSTSGETNFTSTDKLYLLDAKEIYGESFTSSYNTAKDSEKQLDYYLAQGVTTSNFSGAIKQYNGSNDWWWMRSANSDYTNIFCYVTDHGNLGDYFATHTFGVSPAFRIG